MGTTFHYTNLTKREWFHAAALGGNPKMHGLGHSLTAHAFDLLLVDEASRNADIELLGRWSGDSIAIVGDEDPDTWLRYQREFADLGADVAILVFRCDGFEPLAEVAEHDDGLFFQMCHLVVTRQAPYLEAPMRERFGPKYLQRFKALREADPLVFVPMHSKDLKSTALPPDSPCR